MAKTLVGLYATLTEAEQVIQALSVQGFAPSDMMLATPHATVPRPANDPGIQTCSTLGDGGRGLEHTLHNLGVAESDRRAYVDGVRQGGALVLLQAADDQADRGMDILQGQHPAADQERPTPWRYVGGVGVASRPATALNPVPGAEDLPGARRYDPDFRRHHAATYPESGLTYVDDEPAYRYGYDLGERYPQQRWEALEAAARHNWERWRPGTWERVKAAVRYGWDTVRGRL